MIKCHPPIIIKACSEEQRIRANPIHTSSNTIYQCSCTMQPNSFYLALQDQDKHIHCLPLQKQPRNTNCCTIAVRLKCRLPLQSRLEVVSPCTIAVDRTRSIYHCGSIEYKLKSWNPPTRWRPKNDARFTSRVPTDKMPEHDGITNPWDFDGSTSWWSF